MVRTTILIAVAVALALVLEPGTPSRAEPVRATAPRAVGPDVSPQLPPEVYQRRRERLLKKLGGCAGAIKSFSSEGGDGNSFDSYFFYLTGTRKPRSGWAIASR